MTGPWSSRSTSRRWISSKTISTRSEKVADAAMVTTPFILNPGALSCGYNVGSPVTPEYASPFKFTGILHR